MGYYPCVMATLTRITNRDGRQCQMGSLTGAVASQSVTEAREGKLRTVGNRPLECKGISLPDCDTDR